MAETIKLKGKQALTFITLGAFQAAEKEGNTLFDGKITAYNVIEYPDDKGNMRQLAVVDVKIGNDGVTTGIISLPMLKMVKETDGNVQLQFTGSRLNEYENVEQPTFRVKGLL